jgi:hypothetical protein
MMRHIIDGDEIRLKLETKEAHIIHLGELGDYKFWPDTMYILTPKAYRRLARGYVINFLERWLITESKILFKRLRRRIKK